METVRTGPIVGLVAQVVLLAALAGTIGLGIAGWAVGLAYGGVLCALLVRALRRMGRGLAPADWITLSRSTLIGCAAALTADSFQRRTPVDALVAVATVALALDAVDGLVARRTGTASGFGARFDMEVDAFLILVLSVYVARSMGLWVLTIGLMRYAYVVAGWALPWLRRPVPPRYWCKVVAAVQGVVLVTAAADLLPATIMVGAIVAALALLVESFGRDVVWQWQQRLVAVPASERW